MFLAQKLYEGVEVGDEGLVGLITYMRTDSTRVSQDALTAVRNHIQDTIRPGICARQNPISIPIKSRPRMPMRPSVPTSMNLSPETLTAHLDKDLLALYRLIWNRFVASQMKAAVYDQTSVDIQAGDYLLRATGSILRFPGFTTVYEVGKDIVASEDEEEEKKGQLPDLQVQQILTLLQINPQAALYPTAAPLYRGHPGQGVGRKRDRPSQYLCGHHLHDPG